MKPREYISRYGPDEILFEFRRLGNVLRVCAIDPDSHTEVIMVGDPKQSMEVLKRLAARKLMYVMRKKGINTRRSKYLRGKVKR